MKKVFLLLVLVVAMLPVVSFGTCTLFPITGIATLCAGSTTTLGDPTTGGTWSSSDITVATVDVSSGVVSGIGSGTSTITYALDASCYVTQVVTVSAAPSYVTGTGITCIGTSTTLANTVSGGIWTSSAPGVATVDAASGVVTGVGAGTATISYTLSSGCSATMVATIVASPSIIVGVTTACVGYNTTLVDGTAGGTWSSGSTSVATVGAGTGIVTGVTSGTVVITYAINPSCYVTKNVTVNVPPPAPTGPGVVCVGSTITMTDASTGGIWSTSTSTYGTIDVAAGVVTGIAGGTTVVTYTLSGCFNTTNVTIKPLPAAIVGPSLICIGSTSTLTDATTPGTWASSTPGVITIDAATGIINGVALGTSTITYTSSAGCSITSVLTVSALPPAITGTLSVCEGATTTLSDATTGGTWVGPGGSVVLVGVSTGIVTGLSAGTGTVTYRAPTGCSVTAVVTVNTLPPAPTGTMMVCLGQSATLSDGTSGGTWVSGTTTVASIDAATGIYLGTGAGTADITYVMPTGCNRDVVVTVNALPASLTGTMHVCVGLTTTLATTSTGGTWSSSSANATISSAGVVTGATAGTATISYTFSTGCASVAVVTVNAIPPAISGTRTVCQAKTTTLSDSSPGGTWSSSATAVGTIGAANGVLGGIAGGTTTITFTSTAGCITTSVATVNPAPSTISGTLAVCQGLTTTLSDAGGGTWASSSANATITSGGVVTGSASGTSTITYTLSTGCYTTSVVTVNALPAAIGGTKTVCTGLTTTLTDASGTGAWTSGTTSVATVNISTGVVTGVAAGTSAITFTLSTGCTTTAIVTVNAGPSAISGPSGICLGSTVTFTDVTTPGTWSSSNGSVVSIASATGIATGAATGTANVSYTIANGCYMRMAVTVNSLPASITGPATVCAASAITLSDATTGGTWASSVPANATVGVLTGIVTGLTAGTTTITYIAGTGCYVTTVITVNGVTAASITPVGATTFCPGGFVLLNGNSGAGLLYQWSDGSGAIAGATNSSYIATATDNYTLVVYNGVGCSASSAPVVVTVDDPTATISVGGFGSTTICGTGSITMSANTGTGYNYQWQASGTNIPGATGSTYSATAAGDYDVVVTNGTGCSATSAVTTVSVSPLPSAVLSITGSLTFCDGGSVTLGVPSATGNTYQWYSASGILWGAISNTFTTSSADDYWVEVANASGCSATSATATVVVNALPPATVAAGGSTLFCSGGSVTLDAPVGTYDYQWYNGATALAGATNANYTASATGNYTVKVTDLATGCSATSTTGVGVTVVPMPVIVPLTPTAYCWGGNALLSTSVAGLGSSITYQWYKDGTPIVGGSGSTYNATTPGMYSADITVVGSCTFTVAAVAVTENPLPNPVVTFDGTLFHAQTYYVSYQWYKDAAMIPGATASVTAPIGNGDYKVAVTDTNGCQSVAAVYTLSGWTSGTSTTGTATVTKENVRIYPNPTQQAVHVECPGMVRVLISSMDGRTLIDTHGKDINLSQLANGLYMIGIFDATSGKQVITDKLVKE